MNKAPVKQGGIVRVRCDTTDGQRVDADVTAESINLLGCGCWAVRCTRPGPDVGPCTCWHMEVIFQRCGRFHDDGSHEDAHGTVHPAPLVLRYSVDDPADNCEGQDDTEDDAHERAHEAGSATLVPRADCPECRRDAGLLPLDCED